MTKSERIRELAASGLSTAQVARMVGVRYQFAYKVIRRASQIQEPAAGDCASMTADRRRPARPPLHVATLEEGGFTRSGRWLLGADGRLEVDGKIPDTPGVYVFVMDDAAVYVGLATTGLRRRLEFYRTPGPSQRTNIRLNDKLKRELSTGSDVAIFTASPGSLEWNGLPVHGAAGLELGLIRAFAAPWNLRSL